MAGGGSSSAIEKKGAGKKGRIAHHELEKRGRKDYRKLRKRVRGISVCRFNKEVAREGKTANHHLGHGRKGGKGRKEKNRIFLSFGENGGGELSSSISFETRGKKGRKKRNNNNGGGGERVACLVGAAEGKRVRSQRPNRQRRGGERRPLLFIDGEGGEDSSFPIWDEG